MPIATASRLVDACGQFKVLTPDQLNEISRKLLPSLQDPKALARELIRRGWLTPFQVNQLFQDRGLDLLLGPYLLLERLGEGGMGQVFKAKHRHMERVVAIKLIRKKHLSKPEAVQRFQREIQAVAKLSNPHVVMALDAQCDGDTHFFVMEYVDGADLLNIVRKNGPQPVAQACEYMRQAALGLQHAHERGMVHRDIKPSNLLVSRQDGVVKILDMGLARVGDDLITEGPGEQLTQVGRLMGTPEYMAPEQAINAHGADIRADLYSLGCTFYYLLAGRPPFAEGTAVDRILKHQTETPVPVEQRRPDVPPPVAAVVARLLAKKPQDRYQTPAELAAVLGALLRPSPAPAQPVRPAAAPQAVLAPPRAVAVAAAVPPHAVPVAPPPPRETVAIGDQWDTSDLAPPPAVPSRRYARRAQKPANNSLLWVGIGAGAALLLGLLLWAAWPSDPPARARPSSVTSRR
jgi:serine/threonine protein kinase